MDREENARREQLADARAHYDAQCWRGAFDSFVAADATDPLDADDLERLTWCAAMIGRDDRFFDALERLYQLRKDAGSPARAARCAFWLGFRSMALGESARGSGWFGRCERLVEETRAPCVERGYLLLPRSIGRLRAGEYAEAAAHAREAATIGEAFADADLVALARDLEGRALVRSGEVERGLALFDEGMLAASGGELSPLVTGLILCSVISSCKRVFAWERAREWTTVLAEWCDAQPDLVTFRGACQVNRSEVLQLAGEWTEAMVQVARVATDGPDMDRDAAGDVAYQLGELHRLRGAFEEADAAYSRAAAVGREPQPGLALLRAAQARPSVASSGIERALAEHTDPLTRARLLPAVVEIALVVGDLASADASCTELEKTAARHHSAGLDGVAAFARGLHHLAADDPRAALGPLRHAYFVWQRMGAPYEEARTQVALARACGALGDAEGAARYLDSARATFTRLEAAPDLAALDAKAAAAPPPRGTEHALSPRELQVLRLVATGMTNRAVAEELALSEKTVDRHVSNIFTKIGVGSRTAATAYAYENGLIGDGPRDG